MYSKKMGITMKNLLIIFMLVSSVVYAQDSWISNDKLTHFNTSMTLTFASGQMIEGLTGWRYSNEVAAMTVMFAGVAKEVVLDREISGKDIAYNAAGVVVGYYVNKFINKKIRGGKRI